MRKWILCAMLLAGLTACEKLEYDIYDNPFVYFDSASLVNVDAAGLVSIDYDLVLSSAARTDNLTVTISVTVGNGLTSGVDYMIISDTDVVFEPDTYTVPFRIRWMRNPVDDSKDNTLKVEILAVSDDNVTIGIPGPAGNGKSITFEKYN